MHIKPLALALAAAFACAPAPAAAFTRLVIGHSLEGRPIYAYEAGSPGGRTVLVVGCIHGNEPAGIAIARALTSLRAPQGVDLWVVPDVNPDGVAAGTRANAHGVDLNRNFPYAWSAATGGSGPRALSEPESRAVYALIRRVRPALSIWFHQHLSLVDDSQGSRKLELRFARLVGLPAMPLVDYPGSVTNWESHTLKGATAFVVELGAGSLSPGLAHRFAAAVLAVS